MIESGVYFFVVPDFFQQGIECVELIRLDLELLLFEVNLFVERLQLRG